MAEEKQQTKFSEEDLKSLKDLQEKYFQVQQRFGNIRITRMNLHKQLSELDDVDKSIESDYSLLKESEKKLVDEFTKKYGQGNLDTKTGVFTGVETNV